MASVRSASGPDPWQNAMLRRLPAQNPVGTDKNNAIERDTVPLSRPAARHDTAVALTFASCSTRRLLEPAAAAFALQESLAG